MPVAEDSAVPAPAGQDGGRPARTVADRLLGVLDAFDQTHRRLTLSELARRTGLPLATTHRMVARLTCWGALERAEDGSYTIGLRLWEVAALAPRGLGLREAALPYLEDLYEATHENVHLAVADGVETVYIERLSGREAVGVLSRVGARWPLSVTGVGLVLAAHAAPAVQSAVCAHPPRAFTPYTITDPARIRAMLAEVRRTGLAVSDRQITDDALSAAAPIRSADGTVVAAVGLVVRAGEGRVPELAPTLRVAARGISRALGWPGN
ncbi:IclR family transcriptional regulator [Phaeacidiphilus oryzae]|uniref:IclR family transcriptional regulator n=1 Tax=Phaeacidiphilus oryzae TaxID=348818 RepID=UPI00068B0A86|nr:IclR family transcriptional regulator [Phaeacidiphilus oryzae]